MEAGHGFREACKSVAYVATRMVALLFVTWLAGSLLWATGIVSGIKADEIIAVKIGLGFGAVVSVAVAYGIYYAIKDRSWY